MEPSVILTAPDRAPARGRAEVLALAEALAARMQAKRLGAKASVRLRRRKTRRGREWEARVFLGKGGRLLTVFDAEVAQVTPDRVRFALGSAYDGFLDLVYPPAPPEPERPQTRLGPRQRLSLLGA